MGIKFRCATCDKKLHVKSFLAGKRGICPHCGARVRIPEPAASAPTVARVSDSASSDVAISGDSAVRAESQVSGQPAVGSTAAGVRWDALQEDPAAVWYVRPPGGGQYGPADGNTMQRWLDEGRVAPQALVWREGWSGWETAETVFPSGWAAETSATRTAPGSGDPTVGTPHQAVYATTRAVAQRKKSRAGVSTQRRNLVVIAVLVCVCATLLVALAYVLYQQS